MRSSPERSSSAAETNIESGISGSSKPSGRGSQSLMSSLSRNLLEISECLLRPAISFFERILATRDAVSPTSSCESPNHP